MRDGQTDGQTACRIAVCAVHTRREIKTEILVLETIYKKTLPYRVRIVGGWGQPPPQFMSTDGHFFSENRFSISIPG